jgi:hypothetical protein
MYPSSVFQYFHAQPHKGDRNCNIGSDMLVLKTNPDFRLTFKKDLHLQNNGGVVRSPLVPKNQKYCETQVTKVSLEIGKRKKDSNVTHSSLEVSVNS